jgi:hypothetical protein
MIDILKMGNYLVGNYAYRKLFGGNGDHTHKNTVRMTSLNLLFLVLLAVIAVFPSSAAEDGGGSGSGKIYDPAYIFCGSENCYDVLRIDRTATAKDVKKAYRRLSLTHHPDKSKEENATKVFQLISKAYEVLDTNESRALFDYYLDHPRVSVAMTDVRVNAINVWSLLLLCRTISGCQASITSKRFPSPMFGSFWLSLSSWCLGFYVTYSIPSTSGQ